MNCCHEFAELRLPLKSKFGPCVKSVGISRETSLFKIIVTRKRPYSKSSLFVIRNRRDSLFEIGVIGNLFRSRRYSELSLSQIGGCETEIVVVGNVIRNRRYSELSLSQIGGCGTDGVAPFETQVWTLLWGSHARRRYSKSGCLSLADWRMRDRNRRCWKCYPKSSLFGIVSLADRRMRDRRGGSL